MRKQNLFLKIIIVFFRSVFIYTVGIPSKLPLLSIGEESPPPKNLYTMVVDTLNKIDSPHVFELITNLCNNPASKIQRVREDLEHLIYITPEDNYHLLTDDVIYSADTFDDILLIANNLHCIVSPIKVISSVTLN